jgi:hypothetical protein|tara:strand:- start:441 stop:632 length:192 start_codon:yes stop_codon:yes gene_type:complete
MANVGMKNRERAEVPFVNIAVPIDDRERLRDIAHEEGRTMARQVSRMIREEHERRFGNETERD